MLFLERARFIHIGAPDCRIDDLTISALDDRGRPVDTVVWLRNGGGKTVLLGLFFAHLLPGARDFLKHYSRLSAIRLTTPDAPPLLQLQPHARHPLPPDLATLLRR